MESLGGLNDVSEKDKMKEEKVYNLFLFHLVLVGQDERGKGCKPG